MRRDTFTCSMCGKFFESKSEYDSHRDRFKGEHTREQVSAVDSPTSGNTEKPPVDPKAQDIDALVKQYSKEQLRELYIEKVGKEPRANASEKTLAEGILEADSAAEKEGK